MEQGNLGLITALSGIFAVLLAIAHLLAGTLQFLHHIPRSRWLSLSGGVSVAYVFIHILPDLSAAQETVKSSAGFAFLEQYLEHHVYLVALLGLTAFYGLERLAKVSRRQSQQAGTGDSTETPIFWVHILSFALYNALIGYLLLHREENDLLSLCFFMVAMALHFLVNDDGLRQHHKQDYDRIGRWILAGAIMTGWVIGTTGEISQAAIAVLFAFLAGGIVLNVLKEELPEERESCFWCFGLGIAGYTTLLLLL